MRIDFLVAFKGSTLIQTLPSVTFWFYILNISALLHPQVNFDEWLCNFLNCFLNWSFQNANNNFQLSCIIFVKVTWYKITKFIRTIRLCFCFAFSPFSPLRDLYVHILRWWRCKVTRYLTEMCMFFLWYLRIMLT